MLPVTINSQEKGKEKQKTLHLPLLFITKLLYSLRNYNTCRMNKSLIFLSVFQSLQTFIFQSDHEQNCHSSLYRKQSLSASFHCFYCAHTQRALLKLPQLIHQRRLMRNLKREQAFTSKSFRKDNNG